MNTNYSYRNCNDEVAIKLLSNLTKEIPELEHNMPKQLQIRRVIEETLYDYEVTSKETALTTSDFEGKINYFLATKKLEGLSETTIKGYFYSLRKLDKFFNKPVSTVTPADIKMLMYAESENKNPSSLNSFMTPIKLFFKWLQNEEFITKDPCANIKPVKEPKRVRKPLTEEQLEMLRDADLTKRERAVLEFFVSTGCRVGEVRNVKLKDIDFTNKTLLVIGKGNKQRRVYFTERCKRAILNYIRERESKKIFSDYLFVGSKFPFNKMSNRSYEIMINKMQVKAGLDIHIHPHILRHTFATQALRSGMKPEIIQKILGHEDIGVTLRVYAKLAENEVEHSYRMLVS